MFRLLLLAGICSAVHAQPKLTLTETQMAAKLPPSLTLGTVSSVAIDSKGVLYVLHRGDKADPVVVVNQDGKVLRSWGKGMFTVPHSIRIDPDGNVWTVDAGSSVLQKFTPEGKKLQEISVGEVATGDKCAFPTLCGTTDVTFGPNGRLFISDGYGNARVLEYSADGRRVKVWGGPGKGPGEFQIPHGIAYDRDTLYVADRTNARIQRFDLNGKYLGEWNNVGRPFALQVSGGALWVAGMTLEQKATPQILKIDMANGNILGQTAAPGPHSIGINANGELAASGCCGGSTPTGFSFFRK
jgi:DNA-binding beta-propeller fold protein YncE